MLAAALVKCTNHSLKRIRTHERLVARQKEAAFPVAFDSPRKARTDAFAAQLAIVQHARAMLVLANPGDLGPTRRNHDVKALGNRIDGPGNQRLAIDIGEHLVGAKSLALARGHNHATEFHLRKPPLAALDTIVAIPTIPSSHSVGTGTRSFFPASAPRLSVAQRRAPRDAGHPPQWCRYAYSASPVNVVPVLPARPSRAFSSSVMSAVRPGLLSANVEAA